MEIIATVLQRIIEAGWGFFKALALYNPGGGSLSDLLQTLFQPCTGNVGLLTLLLNTTFAKVVGVLSIVAGGFSLTFYLAGRPLMTFFGLAMSVFDRLRGMFGGVVHGGGGGYHGAGSFSAEREFLSPSSSLALMLIGAALVATEQLLQLFGQIASGLILIPTGILLNLAYSLIGTLLGGATTMCG